MMNLALRFLCSVNALNKKLDLKIFKQCRGRVIIALAALVPYNYYILKILTNYKK